MKQRDPNHTDIFVARRNNLVKLLKTVELGVNIIHVIIIDIPIINDRFTGFLST